MKNFTITYLEETKVLTANVKAADKTASYSQAKIQGICHWSQILTSKEAK